ncbi:MAG: hypothetical protein H6737_24695 [Alphaproteobacteria bacterium]|nr:hypothetical protein [Alphaproteobacteria bacterium]
MAFYGKERRVLGIRVRAHRVVSDAALDVADARIRRLLGGCPAVAANLEAAGAELHVIGADQAVTDLPMYRHMRGKPFDGALTMDQRGRGYGGLFACTAEESLLGLPTARHADHRDVCSHELAHTVQDYGLDAALRDAIRSRYEAALAEGLWPQAYAATNASEFWAELSMWYVGSRGDFPRGVTAEAGAAWLRAYDPASFALLDAIYAGRRAPARFAWHVLSPTRSRRSRTGAATSIVAVNPGEEPVDVAWIDYQGDERPYGVVPPGGAWAQSTYVTHLWRFRRGGRTLGTYEAAAEPGRVLLHDSTERA